MAINKIASWQKDQKFIKGISVVEILVAITILAVVSVAFISLVSTSFKIIYLTRQNIEADSIARETVEAVRGFRDQTDWGVNGLGIISFGSDYHPEIISGPPSQWSLALGEEIINEFTRKIVFERVYRDVNDNISSSGTEDTDTKKITVTVSWQRGSQNYQTEIITYFTNWQN